MQKLLLVSAFCFCLCSYASGNPVANFLQAITVKNCGRSTVPFPSPDRIVGGQLASRGQFPWMVSLFEDRYHACGATILNEYWVVTAAHCFDYPRQPYRYEILAGLHKLSRTTASTVQRITAEKVILHERYDAETSYNDIALIKLEEPLDIEDSSGYVNGICLPETSEDHRGNAVVTGWGHEWQDGSNSDTLKVVVVPIADRDYCTMMYTKYVKGGFPVMESQVCAGDENKDSCQNDSGGPLIQIDRTGKATLIGVVSNGAGCGLKGFPGIYTRVYSFIPWMRRQMARN